MSVFSEDMSNSDDQTAFSILSSQYPNVSDKIKTEEFLKASECTVSLIEKFGKVFAPVIYDMKGNIKKLYDKFNKDKERFHYIEDIILSEQQEGDLVATDALQWLRRGLHFLSCFFQSIVDDSDCQLYTQNLSPFIKKSYTETLERYHGWLGTQLFNVLSRFVPNRQQLLFILSLEQSHKEELVIRDMRQYTQHMMGCVRKLIQFYTEHRLESPPVL